MDNTVNFRLLGPVEVTVGNLPVRGFESRKALALVCYLAAMGQPLTRSHLADLFWGEKTDAQSRGNLSRVLHHNRRLLPGCLIIDRTSVRFAPSTDVWLDVTAFDTLVTQGDAGSLASAVDLVKGDFMADIMLRDCADFDTWLVTQVEAWHQREALVLRRLITLHRHAGHYEQGLTFARRLLALDPWRESAHYQTMILLALSGQRMAALAQYETCRQILQREFGVEPSPDIRRLHARLKAGEHIRETVHQPAVRRAGPSGLSSGHHPLWVVPIARTQEDVARIVARLVLPTCRMVTVTGAGEAHRQRLAFQVTQQLSQAFAHGIYTLIPSAGGSNLEDAIIDKLSLALDDRYPATDQLLRYVREKEALFIISDPEQYPDVSNVLEHILQRAPWVKILVIASRPVNLGLECVYDL